MEKIDKRKKYYFVLDTETATLPFVTQYTPKEKQQIAIAKPLIYDIGWKIIDKTGRTYLRKSFLVSEIFSVPHIFNTAYYASKRPVYLEKLRNKEITLASWEHITQEMVEDIEKCIAVGAYNSMFDYKKAIHFTEQYITALYSDDYFKWEDRQKQYCDLIIQKKATKTTKEFDPDFFEFRGKKYPLFDIWGLSCEKLLNNDEFRDFCKDNNLYSQSRQYYSTRAETTYKFIKGCTEFVEAHMAVEDADIECEILAEIFKKTPPKKLTMGIIYFPFRIIGNPNF